jgi:hypothetical protein
MKFDVRMGLKMQRRNFGYLINKEVKFLKYIISFF